MDRNKAILADRQKITDFRQALSNQLIALSNSSLFDQTDTSTARFQLGVKFDKATHELHKLLGDWEALYDDAASIEEDKRGTSS